MEKKCATLIPFIATILDPDGHFGSDIAACDLEKLPVTA